MGKVVTLLGWKVTAWFRWNAAFDFNIWPITIWNDIERLLSLTSSWESPQWTAKEERETTPVRNHLHTTSNQRLERMSFTFLHVGMKPSTKLKWVGLVLNWDKRKWIKQKRFHFEIKWVKEHRKFHKRLFKVGPFYYIVRNMTKIDFWFLML